MSKHVFRVLHSAPAARRQLCATVEWDRGAGTFTDEGLAPERRALLKEILEGDGTCSFRDHPVGGVDLKLPKAAKDPVQFRTALMAVTEEIVEPPAEFADLDFDWCPFCIYSYDPNAPACLDLIDFSTFDKHRFEVWTHPGPKLHAVVLWDPEAGTFTDEGLTDDERAKLTHILEGDGKCFYRYHFVGGAELKLPNAAKNPVQFNTALMAATSGEVRRPDAEEFDGLDFDWSPFCV